MVSTVKVLDKPDFPQPFLATEEPNEIPDHRCMFSTPISWVENHANPTSILMKNLRLYKNFNKQNTRNIAPEGVETHFKLTGSALIVTQQSALGIQRREELALLG